MRSQPASYFFGTTASAQTLKSGTLSLVVPFAAGGPSDVAGRILAQGMQEALGQTVVVENPVGGGGTVGSLRVSRGTPDGSAFVLGNNGTHSWSQSLYKNPPYETMQDFTPLGLAVESPRVIIVPKDLPANTLPEFIAYVKANQDKIQFASAGAGSASHVSCILLNAMLGVNVTHVPYRGLGPAMQDLIAGRVQYICDLGVDLEAADRGRLRQGDHHHRPEALAGAAEHPDRQGAGPRFRRADLAGPVPRQGHAGADRRAAQRGASARRSTCRRCAAASSRSARKSPRADRRTPEYFAKFVAGEIARWSGPIKASGVTVE